MSQGAIDLPFNLWTFLSLPSLYFTWSLLLLGLVLFFCLFTPGHQPFSWDVAILDIPIPIPVLSTGLSLLVTLIPCSLVARNFQVLSQVIEPPTTPKSSESKPMDLSSPSNLESTGLVASGKVLGLVPTAAHVILGYALYCIIESRQCSNLSRQLQSCLPCHRRLLQRPYHTDFAHNCHHRGILCRDTSSASQSTVLGPSLASFSIWRRLTYDQAHTKRVLVLPIAFLALSALASLFGLLALPIWRLLG